MRKTYCFIALGSQAREEQTIKADQDNALLLSDEYDAEQHKKYFENLSFWVCQHLDTGGYALCTADIMASNSRWRQRFGRPPSLRLGASRQRYHLPRYKAYHALTDALSSTQLLQAQMAYYLDPDANISKLLGLIHYLTLAQLRGNSHESPIRYPIPHLSPP